MKIGGRFLTISALGALLAGCSSDGGILGSSLTTSSVDAKPAVAAVKTDPACVALTAKIDALRKDGVTERAEKAAVGKTTTVNVKRDSLAKLTELDRANADYQSKCSAPGLAKPMPSAAAAPAAPAAPQKVSTAVTTAKPAKAVQKAAVVPAPAAAAPVAAAAAAIAPPAPPVQAVAAPVAAPIVATVPQGVAPVAVTVPAQPAVAAPLPAAAAAAKAVQQAVQ